MIACMHHLLVAWRSLNTISNKMSIKDRLSKHTERSKMSPELNVSILFRFSINLFVFINRGMTATQRDEL